MCLYSRSFGNRQQNILESSVIFWSEISRNRNVLGGFQAIAQKLPNTFPLEKTSDQNKPADSRVFPCDSYRPTDLADIN